jgi:hypothetical protein
MLYQLSYALPRGEARDQARGEVEVASSLRGVNRNGSAGVSGECGDRGENSGRDQSCPNRFGEHWRPLLWLAAIAVSATNVQAYKYQGPTLLMRGRSCLPLRNEHAPPLPGFVPVEITGFAFVGVSHGNSFSQAYRFLCNL